LPEGEKENGKRRKESFKKWAEEATLPLREGKARTCRRLNKAGIREERKRKNNQGEFKKEGGGDVLGTAAGGEGRGGGLCCMCGTGKLRRRGGARGGSSILWMFQGVGMMRSGWGSKWGVLLEEDFCFAISGGGGKGVWVEEKKKRL